MDMLLKPTVWLDAANQVFYSFGLAFGSIISFGSYNNPKKNCVKAGDFIFKYFPPTLDVLQDVIILSICNAFTAIYACAVIFSILGFKAVHLFEKCMEQWVNLTNPIIILFEMNFSDVKILSEKYSSEFHERHVQDIPEEEYQLAVAGYTK